MHYARTFFLSVALLLPTFAVAAETQGLSVTGSTRVRYEALSGQARAGLNDELSLTSLRTIITATYQGDGLRMGAELYDSRAWGGKAGDGISTTEINTFELVQAWVGGDLGQNAKWQAGRFTVNVGSRRLIAADDYRNTTNGYTGLRVDAKPVPNWEVTALYVMPQLRLPDDQPSLLNHETVADRESLKSVLWGGLARRSLNGVAFEVGYFGFEEKDTQGRPTRDRDLRTVDLRLIRDPKAGQFDYEAEVMYQYGTVSASTAANAAERDVSAWFVHADAGYSFTGPLKARLSVEYDYASGDEADGKYGRFDTLFGMRRADFAPAGIYAQIGRANISTPAVRFEIAPSPRWDAFLAARSLWLASRTDAFSTTGVRDATGASGSFAGHQIEGRYRYWIVPSKWRAEINAAWLIKGRFLKDAPNASANDEDTRYISVALSRNF